MVQTETNLGRGLWGLFFASPEERLARRRKKAQARKTQKELDRKVQKDLQDSGYFNEHMPDAYFYRHYYF